MMQSIKEALHQINVDQVTVPSSCTKYVQAPDVSWNKPFKALVSEQYDEWMASGVQEFTEAGNMRPPPRKTIVEWVLTAWARLPTEVITKSFKSCALNLVVDGSQDSEIHCFKKGQPCKAGAEQLKAQLSVLDEPTLPDPFQEITNSDIEEAGNENTMVLDEDSDVDIEL